MEELELYIKHMAWLYASPRVDPKSKQPRQTRAEKYRKLIEAGRDTPALELPIVEHAGYLLEYLSEIGEARVNGSTLSPIDWQEITAWQHATGTELTSWDSKALRRLSEVYVSQYHAAEDPACPPPWMPAPSSDQAINRKLDNLINTVSAK